LPTDLIELQVIAILKEWHPKKYLCESKMEVVIVLLVLLKGEKREQIKRDLEAELSRHICYRIALLPIY
jgi:hypothetical protein